MSPRTDIAVVGAGIVGARVARELLTPLPNRTGPARRPLVVTRRQARRDQLAQSFGRDAVVDLDAGGAPALPDSVGVVVLTRAAGEHLELARHLVDEGRNVVSTSDDADEVAALMALDADARRSGCTVIVGAAMSPGWSCLLAAHAATLLDEVDEIHVARHGAAGPACARQRLRALRGNAAEWREREWVKRSGFSGRELLWFPDPVAAADCYRAALAEPLVLQPAFGDVRRVTARLAANRRDRALAPFPVLVPPPSEGRLGAVRVEVRGAVGGERSTVVYGALDRPGVAAGAVAAVAALYLSGDVGTSDEPAPGARGLAGTGEALAMLTELARRGVRAATFVGA